MPKTKSEATKKHGDKLEPLIDRTGSRSSPEERNETPGDDPAELQDDDDEDVQNDEVEDRRDIGGSQ